MSSPDAASNRIAAKLAAALIGVGAIYLTLVLANLVLVEAGRAFNAGAGDPAMLAAIDDRKAADKTLIADARDRGLTPLIYPDMLCKPGAFDDFTDAARASRLPMLASHPNAETYYCNEGYGLVAYESDRFGMRNPDTAWDAATTPGAMSLAIGDSFVHGACVADGKTIPAVMTAAGRPTLNLATASNNPLHYAFLARAFTPLVKPERLILFFYANDNLAAARLEDTQACIYADMLAEDADLSTYFAADAADAAGGPQPSAAYADAMTANAALTRARVEEGRGKWSIWDKIFKRDYWTVRHARTMLAGLAAGDAGLDPLSRLALKEASAQCAVHGCEPLVVWIPNSEKTAPDPRAPEYRDRLKAAAAELALPFLDLAPALAPLGDAAFASKGLHLSPAGYAAAAAATAAAIGE